MEKKLVLVNNPKYGFNVQSHNCYRMDELHLFVNKPGLDIAVLEYGLPSDNVGSSDDFSPYMKNKGFEEVEFEQMEVPEGGG